MVSPREEVATVGFRPDGTPVQLTVLRAGEGRPRLFLCAAVHGDELTGLASLWRLWEYLASRDVRGEITVVPVVNVEGLNYSVRGVPLALLDLNRLYPGDPRGSLAERLVFYVWELARKHDFVVDVHTAGNSIPFILVDRSPPATPETRAKTLEVARKLGITVLDELPPEKYEKERLASSLSAVAVANNVPSFTLELPSAVATLDYNAVGVGFKVLKNLLIALGMVKDEYEEITEYPVMHEEGLYRDYVQTEKGGVVEYLVRPGDRVRRGDLIARVRSITGEVLEEIRAPRDCVIVALRKRAAVWTGDEVVTIAVKS